MSQTATKKTPVLPEPEFWKKYSPHHEFPLSSVSSFGLHLVIFGLLVLGGWAISKFLGDDDKPLPVSAFVLDEPRGGGGGDPRVAGPGPGDGAIPPDAPAAPDTPVPPENLPERQNLEARKEALKSPEFQDPDSKRLIEEGGAQVDKILKMNRDVRDKLREGLAAGGGRGGPGSGTGDGAGQGSVPGDGVGDGRGPNAREKRLMRWVMIFNTRDGEDYARQLDILGAILAIPDPAAPERYLTIRDLKERPVKPMKEDLAKIQRIYWIDDKPASIRSLAAAMRMDPVPPSVVAFFPVELEEKLLKIELAFRGKKESDIRETRFEVRKKGDGYEPVVVSQR